jgi:hypothetical protein
MLQCALTAVSAGSSFETRLRRPQDEVGGRAHVLGAERALDAPAFAELTARKVFHVKHLWLILIRESFRGNKEIFAQEQGEFVR